MKKVSKIMWGIVLVAVGVILALNALNITDIDIFFKGWWTLFIIVPSFISLFADRDKTGGIIGMILGIILLLSARGLVDYTMIWKLALPAVVIVVGLELIFHNAFDKSARDTFKKLKDGSSLRSSAAIFATKEDNCSGQTFTGAEYSTLFGTVNCDISDAIFERDVLIKTHNIFGTVKIIVPDGVNVVTNSHSLFGGVSSEIINRKENEITVYVEGYCLFGSVEIK